MDTRDYIFESPDGGETVYVRKPGETTRALYHVSEQALKRASELQETQLWYEIRQAAKSDSCLQRAIERVKILYYMKKHNGSET